jgi:uncharacterized protein
MIIVDTGAFVALLDRRDDAHQQAQVAFGKVAEPLISTYPVITEVCFLLNHSAKCKFLQAASGGLFEVFHLQD